MRKRFFISILFLTIIVRQASGQAVPFLNYMSDPRTAGMGNAGYVLSSAFAAQRNTAAVFQDTLRPTEIAVSYLLWQPQNANNKLVNIGGYTRFKNFSIAAGARFNNMPAVEKTGDNGNVIGTFSPSEYALELGLGYKISSKVAAGATVRYLGSDLGGTKKASALAADVSLLYSKESLSVGLGFSNLGTKTDYGNSKYSLPTRSNTGVAYNYSIAGKHSLTGVLDAAYQLSPDNTGLAGGIGAEYAYDKLLFLRTGYHFEDEKIGASYGTAGCGVHFSGFSVDFAYILAPSDNVMNQTLLVSLKWGG
ncbi:MAG: PorV/PorQ family protein [Draconibacterium sp.]